MAKTLKKWQGWLLFGGAMVIVFVLGLLCSSMLERRAEVASIFNNRRTQMTDSIVSQNEKFAEDFPREYETWAMTEDTSFVSKYNSSQEVDVTGTTSGNGRPMGRIRLLEGIQHTARAPARHRRPAQDPAYRKPRCRRTGRHTTRYMLDL